MTGVQTCALPISIILMLGVFFTDEPTVTTTIHNNSGGTVFGVYGIDKGHQKGQDEVKVSAANVQSGVKSEDYFYCDYVIIGKGTLKK